MAASVASLPATDADIHRIRVPTPFGIGPTNAYLIADDPVTLVDTGPNWGTSLDGLEEGLAELGVRLGDIGMVVLTHQHVDHVGLAGLIARRHGAEVACLDVLAPYLKSFDASIADEYDSRLDTLLANGIEAGSAVAWRAGAKMLETFGGAVEATVPVPDGGTLELRDRTLRFLARPGHSPSDTILVDEASGLVFGGDHLLCRITSNALVDRALPPAEERVRTQALLTYRDSLRSTAELDVRQILPGHGRPIDGHRELIDRRLGEQEERAEEMVAKIDAGGASAHDIAVAVFGEAAATQPFLTISEVVGHLDLAIDAGRIRIRSGGATAVYERSGG
jgi:glyoxylase-like metal-dependent hydrolase (beta-lactamase superfamily II)